MQTACLALQVLASGLEDVGRKQQQADEWQQVALSPIPLSFMHICVAVDPFWFCSGAVHPSVLWLCPGMSECQGDAGCLHGHAGPYTMQNALSCFLAGLLE